MRVSAMHPIFQGNIQPADPTGQGPEKWRFPRFLLLTKKLSPVMSNNIEHNR
jgi:hypothetical protein